MLNLWMGRRSGLLLGGIAAVLAGSLAHLGEAAPAVPDPCKLVTAAEVERAISHPGMCPVNISQPKRHGLMFACRKAS